MNAAGITNHNTQSSRFGHHHAFQSIRNSNFAEDSLLSQRTPSFIQKMR